MKQQDLKIRGINDDGTLTYPEFGTLYGIKSWDILQRWSNVNLWSGLKDKNGKDIYDDDIVEHYGEIFVVNFEEGLFVIKGKSIRINPDGTEYVVRDDLLINQNDVLEVVGNIHQNRKLLDNLEDNIKIIKN